MDSAEGVCLGVGHAFTYLDLYLGRLTLLRLPPGGKLLEEIVERQAESLRKRLLP